MSFGGTRAHDLLQYAVLLLAPSVFTRKADIIVKYIEWEFPIYGSMIYISFIMVFTDSSLLRIYHHGE